MSLEMLEADPAFLATETGEIRASRLSGLWYEHAQRMEEISHAAKLAALLRSAQLAVTPLLGEACRNPFNKTCGELDTLYRQAVRETARTLARTGWELPDLAPTRYQFAREDAQTLHELRAWRIRLEEIPSEFDSIRPGIGLATVGCRAQSDEAQRPGQLITAICSPITFVLRFDQPVEADRITAHIDVVDAYQQSVIAINGENTVLAGNIDAALTALDRDLNTHTPTSRLYCLSLPTRGTTTAIALGNIQSLSSLIRDDVWGLMRDSAIRDDLTFCFYPVSNDIEAQSDARNLLGGVREMVTPRKFANLERGPIKMFIIAAGEPARRTTVAILQRLRRQPHTVAHRGRSRGAPFLLRGVHVTDSELIPTPSDARGSSSALSRAAEELHIPVTTEGHGGASLFSALRTLSGENDEDTRLPNTTPLPEEVSVSPVM